jgi:hypothetical protein
MIVKEQDDLKFVPDLFIWKLRVSRTWESYDHIGSSIVVHDLQTEVERALEPIEDFSSTAWSTTRHESGDFFFRIQQLCFPLIPLVISKLLSQLVENSHT